MHDRILHHSAQQLLDDDDRIVHVVHMFTRHRLFVPYVLGSTGALFVLGIMLGIEQWSGRIGLALGAGALAAMATTEYRVLVQARSGLVLMRSSRIRRKATAVLKRLPDNIEVVPVGSNLVITDFRVGTVIYSVMKRFQAPMSSIASR